MGGAAIAYGVTGSVGGGSSRRDRRRLNRLLRRCVRRRGAHRPPIAARRPGCLRAFAANGLALRSIAIEFGPAEVIDSLIIRPLAFYFGPMLFGGMVAGWIFAKLVADVGGQRWNLTDRYP